MIHQHTGKLYVVATPIGNLDDITYRAVQILRQVTWIAAEDTRHSQGLLQHFGISVPLISYHAHNEHERIEFLLEKLLQGEDGALISDAGTPLISDPGYLLVAKAHAKGISVIPVPGACAAIAALSVAGLPTDNFLFAGFLPAKPQARRKFLENLREFPHTMVFYEAPHRLLAWLEDAAAIFTPLRSLTIAREITKKFESVYVTNFGDALVAIAQGEIPIKGEFIIVVAGYQSEENPLSEQEQEIVRVLQVLLAELPLKQAVQIAVKLTGFPKNKIYACATNIQSLS